MKFTSNKGELTLNKAPNITLARFDSQTYRKWNRILASISCILIFLLLLGIVVRSIWNESQRDNTNCTRTLQLRNYGSSNKCTVSITEMECTIECSDIYNFDDLNIMLKDYENQMGTCNLNVRIIKSRNLNIIQNWIPSDNNNLILNQIEFIGCYIHTIEKNAFVGVLFETLKKLEFKFETTIKLIKENSFDTQRLNELNFQNSHLFKIEPGFASVFHSLHTLQYIQSTGAPKILTNLTLNTNYPQLTTLDFRFDNYWILEKNIFEHLKELKLVFFSGSEILWIGPETFAKNTKLKTIDLSNTQLSYIPENIFGKYTNLETLDLSNNPWLCNCSLQWLKNIWMNTRPSANIPICDAPDEFHGLSFKEVDFCSIINTTPDSSSTNSNENLTTSTGSTTVDVNEISSDVLTVLCLNDGEIHIGDQKLPVTDNDNLRKREIIDFDVFESNGDVIVELDRTLDDYCLLWTNNDRELILDNNYIIDKKNNTGCFTKINQTTSIMTLAPENFYTICLINGTNGENGSLISPFDCKAIKISFFNKRYILWVIIIIAIIIFVLLTLISLVILHRKFSIQKSKTKHGDNLNEITLHDDTHNMHVQWPFPTNNIDTISCALDRSTTFTVPYPQNRRKHRLSRSLSESSFYSTIRTIRSVETESYVSPPEPSALELLNWKMTCIREKYLKDQETPPPLPPYPTEKNTTTIPKSYDHT